MLVQQGPFGKILVIKTRAIGDTVLMTAPLAELRRAFPGAEIHVLVSAHSEPVLRGNPAITRLWLYERPRGLSRRLAGCWRQIALIQALRRERFDCVVNLHASPTSARIARLTGAPVRSVHFHGHDDTDRFSTVTIPGKGTLKPAIERDMDALRALGVAVDPGRLPKIHLSSGEKESGQQLLARLSLPQPILVLGLGASRPTKIWPISRFAALAARWAERTGGGVLATAGPGEEFLTQCFLLELNAPGQLRERITARDDLPLRDLASVLSSAAVFCGNDSGPKHLAVAAGTPTVTVFGPEDPYEWHPYPVNLHPYVFMEGLSCRKDARPGMPPWCGLTVCTDEGHRCMTEIGVEEVFNECMRIALG